MGYELHITRADNWLDSAAVPIERAEWLRVAAENALLPTGSVSFEGQRDEPVFTIGEEDGPSIYWHEGQLVAKGIRGEEDIEALVTLAKELGARLVGDDGEEY